MTRKESLSILEEIEVSADDLLVLISLHKFSARASLLIQYFTVSKDISC